MQGAICNNFTMNTHKENMKEWRERRETIIRLKDAEGVSFVKIAKMYGITRQRVMQIYQDGKK